MQRGDLPAAEAAFRDATRAMPQSAEAYLGLGLVQLRSGAAPEAIGSLEKAKTLDSRLGGAHLFLGIAEYQAGRPDAAVADLRGELALLPDNVEALTWLTLVLLGTDKAEEAVPVVDHAVALQPADPQLLYLQSKAHAAVVKSALARLYALDPDSALVHQATAENLDGSGDPAKAIAEYQLALKKQPDSPDLLEALGNVQQRAGQGDAAAETFRRELTLNPHSGVALYSLGRLEVEHGKAAGGVALLRQAVEAHADPSPTAFYLGLGLAQLGQNEEAAHWLQQALTPQATPFVQQGAWFQLARVYGRLNRKAEQQDALAHLKQVVDAQNQGKGAAITQSPGANAAQATGQP